MNSGTRTPLGSGSYVILYLVDLQLPRPLYNMIAESIDQEAERLRRERRAKMLEIKENMANSLWNRDSVTSAPAVREVDEYNEELTGK